MLCFNLLKYDATCTITRYENMKEITMKNVKETAAKLGNSIFNPSPPIPGRRQKINLNFYFQTSLWCFKRCVKTEADTPSEIFLGFTEEAEFYKPFVTTKLKICNTFFENSLQFTPNMQKLWDIINSHIHIFPKKLLLRPILHTIVVADTIIPR